jgi:Protein of unknown function (DUF2851)
MTFSPIKEDFLHLLWRTKKIAPHHFVTTTGKKIDMLDFGVYNLDSGPDFFNAKISIDDTIWAGNIEMHVFSSDWKKHKHQHDGAYSNVILHVVYEHDCEILNDNNSEPIPTLELKGKIPKPYLDQYLTLMQSTISIPCQTLIQTVNPDKINLWKYSLTIERLQQKSVLIDDIFKSIGHDWEETLYIMLARYFGAKVNTEPFERLARSLPLSIVHKNKDKLTVLEALYFGQAGMLAANYKDEYYTGLQKEYVYQQKKLGLRPVDAVSWKFSKLRPVNFPTIRIAQFAALMYKVSFLFSQIKEAENTNEISNILKCVASEYWTHHYTFDTPSKPLKKVTGSDFVEMLLINAVAPVLYHYGKVNSEEAYIDKAIFILEHISAEGNNITRLWKSLGVSCTCAFDSQALIHLKNNYCHELRCMHCKIGNEIMSGSAGV